MVLFLVFRKHSKRKRPRVRISIDAASTYGDRRAGGMRENNALGANALSPSEVVFDAADVGSTHPRTLTPVTEGTSPTVEGASVYTRVPPRLNLPRTGDTARMSLSSQATSVPPSDGAYLYGKEASAYEPPEPDALPSALPSSTIHAGWPPARGRLVLRNPSMGASALRSQVAALRKEVERLQEEKALRDCDDGRPDALPVYREAAGSPP